MIISSELHRQVTVNKLEELLQVRGEGNSLDFKQFFSLNTQKEIAELTKDILAFANTAGGGHIIFGVADKPFEPVGLVSNELIDTTLIYKAISKYISDIRLMIAVHELKWPDWENKRCFAILYISEYSAIAMPSCIVAYEERKTVVLVKPSDIMVRRGAQSIRAEKSDMEQLMFRKRGFAESTGNKGQELDDNLPPREQIALDFVGRMQELAELWGWFNDSTRRKWLLAGDGGKGKTAIAYEFVTQVKQTAPRDLDYILWFSAKRRQFVEGSIRKIETPDFWDLSSLLDAIAKEFGFTEYLDLPVYEKRERIIKELLTPLKIMLIADDIDSLDPQNEDALEFLSSDLASTPTKVLLTSRRVPFGMNAAKTQVSGLSQEDGVQFIFSRIEIFDLDRKIFSSQIVSDILRVTEGSPLYTEDLLRLCRILPVREAILEWKKRGGDSAREYALKREFDRLNNLAQAVVLACSIPDRPVSLTEIQAIVGRSKENIMGEIPAIQSLFLVSPPRMIEDKECFDVNTNTRTLVLSIFESTDILRRLKEAYRNILGEQDNRDGDIITFLRQAKSLEHLERYEEAKHSLQKALQSYPNNTKLIGQLGILYLRWLPTSRLTDAREQFKRAAELRSQDYWMYRAWVKMEIDKSEWSGAIEAAEIGIKNTNTTKKELHYFAGLAHSRLAKELKYSLQTQRASREFSEAEKLLRQALKDPENLVDYDERNLNSKIFRALVINCEQFEKLHDMHHFMNRWQREHPEDPFAISEGQRIMTKYPFSSSSYT